MIHPIFEIESEFSADILKFSMNSIFAFNTKKEVYWISNTISNNTVKKIAISTIKSSYNNKVSICKTLPLFAYIDINESNVFIMNTQQNKIIQVLKIADSKIESISISDDGENILIGGKNGVLGNWNIYNGQLLNIPIRHKDFVLLSKESPNKRFIVSVGYDKSVMIFDKYKDKLGSLVCNTTSAIKCVNFFKESSILVLGDIKGFVYIIDTNTKNLLHRFQVNYMQIIDIFYYKDSYLFILNENKTISVVDFSIQTKILNSFLKDRTYNSFLIDENQIILSSDNKIIAYNFDDFINVCKDFVDRGEISSAYEFINQNTFLKSEDFYIQLEAKFQSDILEAKALACSNNKNMAINILNNYLNIPNKTHLISNIINEIKSISEFEQLMANSLEVRAIPMVQKKPLLKELKSYIDFETRFSKIILLAKELVKNNKKDDANTIIMQYKKIPSKVRIIQEIFLYPYKVDEAIQAINNKDYKTYFKLKNEYKFVTYLNGASNLEKDGEVIYFKALEAFYSLSIKECKKYTSLLKNFKDYRDFALDLEIKIDEVLIIMEKINSK
ncbi:WD40 repeat domain-containing protein [Helicobacter sp. MIT 14-3879]|uniref:WD40 repeat domain-containing protein n=1 Tax=Helicobacter sp. MIT 14-3879 TaxID=2040649 RepID=UPI000E1EBE04|nr:hypothetical protein [Helicobacter sp. MIT 14-3879]RDU63128.1 hypothetical protein CQA44_05670 [Helicobacter sp. MIT 14-3879]